MGTKWAAGLEKGLEGAGVGMTTWRQGGPRPWGPALDRGAQAWASQQNPGGPGGRWEDTGWGWAQPDLLWETHGVSSSRLGDSALVEPEEGRVLGSLRPRKQAWRL